ncbi:MAG: citrate lyase holo-[acyl-carrier protein] synthase, partial [Clostridia bacterium]|nr:citrate lyase holo-[acyl-carrier protein] synthase [Clostridia bacterium]
MSIVNVTLEEILCARDTRAASQRRLLNVHHLPLVSFTMNIAGPVKCSPLIALAFDAGLEALYGALGRPVTAEIIRPATGCEALLVYDRPASALKAACLALETTAPIGRLYDLDVLDTDGSKLSRSEPRTCLVCGGPVAVCSRSRAHGLEAIMGRTNAILMDFAAGYLAGLAAEALTAEVRMTPKPGLVDEHNNGAHSDMDLSLFLRSIDALTPWFRQITALSLCGADAAALQTAGREAEAAMFRATGGVNTHKGALYSFSVLLAALGR